MSQPRRVSLATAEMEGLYKAVGGKEMTKAEELKYAKTLPVGTRVFVQTQESNLVVVGTIRYNGSTKFDPRPHWLGVELDVGAGRHQGTIQGVQYFEALRPKTAIFCRPKNVKPVPSQFRFLGVEDLRASVTDANKAKDDLKKAEKAAEVGIKALEKELEQEKNQSAKTLADMRQKNEALLSNLTEEKTAAKGVEKTMDELKAKLSVSEEATKKHEATIVTMKEESSRADGEIKRLEQKNEELRQKVEEEKAARATTQTTLKQAQAVADTKLKSMQKEQEKNVQTIDDLERKVEALKRTLQEEQTSSKSSQRKLEEKTRRLSITLQEREKSLENEKRTRLQHGQEMHSRLSESSTELQNMKKRVMELEGEVADGINALDEEKKRSAREQKSLLETTSAAEAKLNEKIEELEKALEEEQGRVVEPVVVEVEKLMEVDEDEEEPETEIFARLLGDDMTKAISENKEFSQKKMPSRAQISRLLKAWLGGEKVQSLCGESLINLVRVNHKENKEVQAAVDNFNHKRETSLPLLELNMGHEILISGIVAWVYVMIGGLLYWKLERPTEVASAIDTGDDPGLWKPASAAFFALTVVSTIGYGATAPRTENGRVLLIPYALLGIPIFSYFLSRVSKVINKFIVMMTGYVLEFFTEEHKKHMFGQGGFNWFMALTLFLETCTALLMGSVVFVRYESWGFFDAVYFSFVTVSTIGFGDMVPETTPTRVLASIYIILFNGSMAGLLGEMENMYGLRFDELVTWVYGTKEEQENELHCPEQQIKSTGVSYGALEEMEKSLDKMSDTELIDLVKNSDPEMNSDNIGEGGEKEEEEEEEPRVSVVIDSKQDR